MYGNEFTLLLTLGMSKKFKIKKTKSKFIIPSLKVFFSDDMAKLYEPIIYGGEHADPPPEGIYYRIVYSSSIKEYCIQYYIYWLEQNCAGFLPIADHKYDYEPIFIYVRPPELFPVGVINSGYSKVLGLSCRFHKAEIRRKEYAVRDATEQRVAYKTSPQPFYPFGGSEGRKVRACVKKYPLAGAIYFDELRPLFGIAECSHVFSGAENHIEGPKLTIPLKRLEDDIIEEWYLEHHNGLDEEPFGHDVSNPFEFPYIKYFDPKPLLRS